MCTLTSEMLGVTFLLEVAEVSVVFEHSLHVLRWEEGMQAVVQERRRVFEPRRHLRKEMK